jgi:hypothetical protein
MTPTPCKIQILSQCHACLSLIFFSPAACHQHTAPLPHPVSVLQVTLVSYLAGSDRPSGPAHFSLLPGHDPPAPLVGTCNHRGVTWPRFPGPAGPGSGSLDAVRGDLADHGRLEEGGCGARDLARTRWALGGPRVDCWLRVATATRRRGMRSLCCLGSSLQGGIWSFPPMRPSVQPRDRARLSLCQLPPGTIGGCWIGGRAG